MVFQTRYPSWIILCYIWLLGFAHTGEAQAAKEGKARGKAKFVLTYLFRCLPEPANGSAALLAAPRAPGDPPTTARLQLRALSGEKPGLVGP